jgi:nitrate reductase cytochrome c-type subunit
MNLSLATSGLATSLLMDISQYAVGAEDIDALSSFQIANFFRRHKSTAKDDCDRAAAKITGSSSVSPTLVQGVASYTVTADANRCLKVVQFRRSSLDL